MLTKADSIRYCEYNGNTVLIDSSVAFSIEKDYCFIKTMKQLKQQDMINPNVALIPLKNTDYFKKTICSVLVILEDCDGNRVLLNKKYTDFFEPNANYRTSSSDGKTVVYVFENDVFVGMIMPFVDKR